jgi:poly(hydroxyalkanoate) depolymerase family esterase
MKLPKFDLTEATRLTREGRLDEALAAIRNALGGAAPSAGATPRPAADPNVIRLPPPVPSAGPREAPSAGLRAKPGFPADKLAGLMPSLGGLEGLVKGAPRPAPEPIPDGARFTEEYYAEAAGSLAYKLYVPSRHDGRPAPLLVMLHGCTQSPDDFAAGTRMNALAEEHGFLVAYPAQKQAANAQKCWNWFNTADQRRDGGEPALIAGVTRQVIAGHAVDPARVYVAGLSAGGAAAAIMGAAYPDLFAAVGVHSGLACGAARDLPSALQAMRQGARGASSSGGGLPGMPPTIVFHGDRDATVSPVNGEDVVRQAATPEAVGSSVEHGKSAGGVGYTRAVQADASGRPVVEHWVLHGVGHAWSGGSPAGSYTDPRGPDASREMLRFFLQHAVAQAS